jgi:hypothetical protein
MTAACQPTSTEEPASPPRESQTMTRTFQDDLDFLIEHVEVLLLSDESGDAQVVLVPEYQGRVMTSTSNGSAGASYGWLNREAVASGERQAHINVFGGEDRFWLGPEGGQFSIFFRAGDPFDLEHWQTPEAIDWAPWDVVESDRAHARFEKAIELTSYAGTRFHLAAERTIRLLGREEISTELGVSLGPETRAVAYASENTIRNTGQEHWMKETGLLSIWILGMFNPSPSTTIVIPFEPGPESELGPVVNDAYFGKVPPERLVIGHRTLFFRGDGAYRSKIGISRRRARPVMGSYDASGGVLTLVRYDLPDGTTDYVNSMWEIQDAPYGGDAANSYNDGPPAPGAKPLGPFYELESSSPAAALAPGESLTHVHRTFHFEGPEAELDAIAMATLGTSLGEIASAFE